MFVLIIIALTKSELRISSNLAILSKLFREAVCLLISWKHLVCVRHHRELLVAISGGASPPVNRTTPDAKPKNGERQIQDALVWAPESHHNKTLTFSAT